MPHIIAQACEGVCDAACVQVCPVDCIYPPDGFSLDSEKDKDRMKAVNEQLYIHPEECIDCGACIPECPVDAIFEEKAVPKDQKQYIAKNYKRFGLTTG